jgi:hypothetical protein
MVAVRPFGDLLETFKVLCSLHSLREVSQRKTCFADVVSTRYASNLDMVPCVVLLI